MIYRATVCHPKAPAYVVQVTARDSLEARQTVQETLSALGQWSPRVRVRVVPCAAPEIGDDWTVAGILADSP